MSALYSYGPTAAFVTPGGVLVPAAHPSYGGAAPIIDYGSGSYSTQLATGTPFAQDVAASVAQYQTAAAAAIQATPQHHLAAAAAAAGHPGYTTAYQTAAALPGAAYHPAPGYAAVSALQPPLATTPNTAFAQHLTAQLQASERLGLANQ